MPSKRKSALPSGVGSAMKGFGRKMAAAREEQLLIQSVRKEGRANVDCDSRMELIVEMLQKAGVTVEDLPELNFKHADAYNGVMMGLRNLVMNPAADEDLSLSWSGVQRDLKSVKRLLRKLVVPKWAMELKESSLASITTPNVDGMLQRDGTPSKDLAQLLIEPHSIDWDAHPSLRSAFEEAKREYAARVVDYYKAGPGAKDELLEVVSTDKGDRLRLKKWSLETLKSQMNKAFNSSSPGYPFNGYSWQSEVEGRSCVEHAFDICDALVTKEEGMDRGFLFFQQSRATGDGGSQTKGQQRLVQAAEISEKGLGHMLAYPFKGPNKLPILSGQRGIQESSRNAKALTQGKISPWYGTLDPTHVGYWDISKWDTAQTDEMASEGFFSVCRLVLDEESELTAKVLSEYERAYMNRSLITAFGVIRPKFLPSGSSITTGLAFCHHEIFLRVIDKLVKEETGTPLFTDFGLQGDDFLGFLCQWNDVCDRIVRLVYAAFGCVIKGEMKIKSLADNQVSAVFLNEAILLYSDIDEDTNAKFPKWNLFWAENPRDKVRGANIDRMLLTEITGNVAHPSPLELTMASLFSKLDRFMNMPFYESLFVQLLEWSPQPIYSWHVERVMPSSPSRAWLAQREEQRGIEPPDPGQRALDREEATWLLGHELGQALVVLHLCSSVSVEAKDTCRHIINVARNTRAFKRAREAMELAGVDVSAKGGDIPVSTCSDLITTAFNVGYKDVAQQLVADPVSQEAVEMYVDLKNFLSEDEHSINTADGEPPMIRTLMRSMLALNDHNPFELRKRMAKVILQTYCSAGWSKLPDEAQEMISRWFAEQYGISLSEAANNPFDDPRYITEVPPVQDWLG